MWIKDLPTWGVLDQVAAYPQARGVVGTRDDAKRGRAPYYESAAIQEPDPLDGLRSAHGRQRRRSALQPYGSSLGDGSRQLFRSDSTARVSCGTGCDRARGHPYRVQEWIGHDGVQTTMMYPTARRAGTRRAGRGGSSRSDSGTDRRPRGLALTSAAAMSLPSARAWASLLGGVRNGAPAVCRELARSVVVTV